MIILDDRVLSYFIKTPQVKKVTTTQSSWPVAVRHALVASRIIEAFILQPSPDTLAHVKQEIKAEFPEIYQEFDIIEKQRDTPHTQAVGMVFGRPCYNPGLCLSYTPLW